MSLSAELISICLGITLEYWIHLVGTFAMHISMKKDGELYIKHLVSNLSLLCREGQVQILFENKFTELRMMNCLNFRKV